MRMHRWLLTHCVLLLLCAITITSCAGTDNANTSHVPSATTVQPIQSTVEIISIPPPTKRNETACVTIRGIPYETYALAVKYKSGWSIADGIGKKTADADGYVTWKWKVGGRTTPGIWKIRITDSYNTVVYEKSIFEVIAE